MNKQGLDNLPKTVASVKASFLSTTFLCPFKIYEPNPKFKDPTIVDPNLKA